MTEDEVDAQSVDLVRFASGATLVTILFILVVGLLRLLFGLPIKREERHRLNPRFSTEGVKVGDELKAEFSKLVIAIAYHNLAEKNKKCPGSHSVGVEEDMKNAFLQAIEEVYLANKDNSHSGIGAVSDRITQLRKKYETP